MIVSVFDRAENIVGKGENAGYQHFLHFPQCFEKASYPDTTKGVTVWEWVKAGGLLIQVFSYTALTVFEFILLTL